MEGGKHVQEYVESLSHHMGSCSSNTLQTCTSTMFSTQEILLPTYVCTVCIHVQRPYTWGGWGPPWPKYFLRALSRCEACKWQSGSMHKQGAPCVHNTQHKHCTLATVLWNTSWYLVTVLCTTAGQVRTEITSTHMDSA